VTYDRTVVFSGYSAFFSTNKTDRHDIADILLKGELNTIKANQTNYYLILLFLGSKYFDHVEFSGTTYTQDDECYGYIGFIFGYQSTQKHYVVLWRHRYSNMDDRGGTKGLQIRVSLL
jgi:hypothetical protein